MGFKHVALELQTASMSADLRNSLWNIVYFFCLRNDDRRPGESWDHSMRRFAQLSQLQFFKRPIDDLEYFPDDFVTRIKRWFFTADFFEIYDFIEWVAQFNQNSRFLEQINSCLKKERSGYRFVGFSLAPITNEAEIGAVNDAAVPRAGFENVAAHIQAAITLLSDKKNPDYRNSIKESISAVEAAARAVAKDEKATLGDALKQLEKLKKIHPALRDGFLKIYGYSSDADGIRHAMSELPNLNEADARFMLVSCSAFSNFLIEESKES